jgi:hypothetical protein
MTELIDFDLADVLAESREYIDKYGWGKGEFVVKTYDDNDDDYEVIGYCAMGGVLYSQEIFESECSTDPRTRAVAAALANALGLAKHLSTECTDDGQCSCVINWVTSWNDDDDRTKDDVLDAFMKAEKIARGGTVD